MAAPPSTRGAPTSRRFIYLIMDGGNDIHTLHRVDTNPLFAAGAGSTQHGPEATHWRSAAGGRAQHGPEATATQPAAATLPLPPPLARFECGSGRQFLPLGRGVEKIVSVDRHRHTVVFDTNTESVRAGPDARHVKWHGHGSTWAEAGGRLYHLGRGPGYEEQDCLDFEVLTYDQHRKDWSWSVLPSPPFDRYMNVTIESFADAGAGAGAASAIRISTRNSGTYAFDEARASWRKLGDWKLPFRGRAQYVADYGLWFGFSYNGAADLCAADLNGDGGRPVRRQVWANIDGHANHAGVWLKRSYLSYLGGGRFCLTRFFPETDNKGRSIITAVVTAVEATRAAASATRERPLQMVSRGSVRYQYCPVRDWPGWTCWAY